MSLNRKASIYGSAIVNKKISNNSIFIKLSSFSCILLSIAETLNLIKEKEGKYIFIQFAASFILDHVFSARH